MPAQDRLGRTSAPGSRPRADNSFTVPGSLFRSGLYLDISGAGLYTLLAALQFAQSKQTTRPFSRAGLTWSTFDAANTELSKKYTAAEFTSALELLRKERRDDERRYGGPQT